MLIRIERLRVYAGFPSFQTNKIPLFIFPMNCQNSRIIILTHFKVLRQSLMLLQITVGAVNRVKLKTLVCIVCTLVCTVTQACTDLLSARTTTPSSHNARVNVMFENESITDLPLFFPGRIKLPDLKHCSQIPRFQALFSYSLIFPRLEKVKFFPGSHRFPGWPGTLSMSSRSQSFLL